MPHSCIKGVHLGCSLYTNLILQYFLFIDGSVLQPMGLCRPLNSRTICKKIIAFLNISAIYILIYSILEHCNKFMWVHYFYCESRSLHFKYPAYFLVPQRVLLKPIDIIA
jgi:hypothetical protein